MQKQNNKDSSSPGGSSQKEYKIGVFVVILSILSVGIFFWLEGTFFNNEMIDTDTVTKKIIQTELLIDKFENIVKAGKENNQPDTAFKVEKEIIEEQKIRLLAFKKQLAELKGH